MYKGGLDTWESPQQVEGSGRTTHFDRVPEMACSSVEHLDRRTSGSFHKVVSAQTLHILRVSAHTLHILLYILLSANASTCVSESTSRVPMASHGVLQNDSQLAFTFCVQLGSPRTRVLN